MSWENLGSLQECSPHPRHRSERAPTGPRPVCFFLPTAKTWKAVLDSPGTRERADTQVHTEDPAPHQERPAGHPWPWGCTTDFSAPAHSWGLGEIPQGATAPQPSTPGGGCCCRAGGGEQRAGERAVLGPETESRLCKPSLRRMRWEHSPQCGAAGTQLTLPPLCPAGLRASQQPRGCPEGSGPGTTSAHRHC